jgi:CheY-like chemotaxis protein
MTGERILIVEDEGLIALHLTELLEREGYTIAGSGFAGEQVLKEMGTGPLPDLILMDIALAGQLDGIETARQIRARYDLPVIFLTAYGDQSRIDAANEVSPYGFLIKPVMDDELLSTIRNAFDRRSGRLSS